MATATAVGGAKFKNLLKEVPPEDKGDLQQNWNKFKSLCCGVVSTSDDTALASFIPDILGESHFLLFLREMENGPYDFDDFLPNLITAGDPETLNMNAVKFAAFMTRLGRNLVNDDQDDKDSQEYWALLKQFLNPDRFPEDSPFQWSIALSLFEISSTLKEKGMEEKASEFYHKIVANDLYSPPSGKIKQQFVLSALEFFNKEKSVDHHYIPKKLLHLLNQFDNARNESNTSLMLAIYAGTTRVAHHLLETTDNINVCNEDDLTALMFACRFGLEKAALGMIAKNANLDKFDMEGRTALMFACGFGLEKTALAMIAKNADLEMFDKKGWTALMLACGCRLEKTALAMIAKNTNLDKAATKGWTALMFACRHGLEKAALAMIAKNADLNKATTEGRTALMFACQEGQENIVQALLDEGANKNHTTKNGLTALQTASVNGHEIIIRVLLEANVELHTVWKLDGNEYTALTLAQSGGYTNIVNLLIEAGAKN